jgi:hypothetical protein
MNPSEQNKVTRQVRIGQVIDGIQKDFSTLPTMNLGGTSYTPAALVTTLQEALNAAKQTSVSKAAWMADVQAERNVLAKVGPTLRYIKAFVVAQFGDTQDASQKLADFGFSPRKVPTKNIAVKSEAIVQGKATRAARGTLGSKQKTKIKGTVPAVPSNDATVAKVPVPAVSAAPPVQVKVPS